MKNSGVTNRYQHALVEPKWQKKWHNSALNVVDIEHAKKPFYNLMMFPYPSAEGLHVGNMYAFVGTDIFGRYKRMMGYDVFEPIGLDGFGIHSENYAFKVGKHPIEQAKRSEANFYRQLSQIGCMYDWTRTVETYNPEYYRWTQWLFAQMFKKGLAYRGKGQVNFCPSCKTVLADEQVIEAKCERCGNIVEKRLLEQWYFRITAYAGKLLENIPSLNWSDKVLVAQKNWIGKKEGINITYDIYDESKKKKITEVVCFTTTPVNFAATFLVLAPEHVFVTHIIEVIKNKQSAILAQYVHETKKKTSQDRLAEGKKKSGVFTGFYAKNHVTNEMIPVWVSDFVLGNVGTGAIQGCPGHDERDYAFARQYNLPIMKVINYDNETHCVVAKSSVDTSFFERVKSIEVYIEDRGQDIALVASKDQSEAMVRLIQNHFVSPSVYAQVDGVYKGIITKNKIMEKPESISAFAVKNKLSPDVFWMLNPRNYAFCYVGDGTMVNSSFLDGLPFQEAMSKTKDYFEQKGWGKRVTTYHLRDWLLSRQRYWGPPIPMIHCDTCERNKKGERKDMAGWYAVPDAELPVLLPNIADYKPGDDGVAPLAKHKEFYETVCPGCAGRATRETDVSDTFLDSSWYFLRYPSVKDADSKDASGPVAHVSRDSLQFDREMKTVTPLATVSLRSEGSSQDALAGATRTRSSKLLLPWNPAITKKWLPVSQYTGGAEHSVLHLMYSRFVAMALKDWGYLDFEEPFPNFYAHGLVIKDGAKMSKSKGNVINPDEYIKLYGIDALRLYLMFMGPFAEGGDFRDASMEGMSRWVGRIWRIARASLTSGTDIVDSDSVIRALHKTVKKVSEDTDKRHYNTAIAAMMEFTNMVGDRGGTLSHQALQTFLLVLAPYAPHLAEELWHESSGTFSVHTQSWPKFNVDYLKEDQISMVVQINGKMRGSIIVESQKMSNQTVVEDIARSDGKIAKHLTDQVIRNVIFVPGKIINFVT